MRGPGAEAWQSATRDDILLNAFHGRHNLFARKRKIINLATAAEAVVYLRLSYSSASPRFSLLRPLDKSPSIILLLLDPRSLK